MIALALCVLIFAAPAQRPGSIANASEPGAGGPRRPADGQQAVERANAAAAHAAARFSFLEPGTTKEADVLARAGEPDFDYDTFAITGDADPDIAPPYPGSVTALKNRGTIAPVHVLDYDVGDGLEAVIVSAKGVVVWAVLPPSPAESTLDKAEALFGAAQHRVETRQREDRQREVEIVEWPAEGVRFHAHGQQLVKKILYVKAAR